MDLLASPWWVGIGRLGLIPVAALLSWMFARLAVRLAIRSVRQVPADAHWSERARLTFPARVAMGGLPWVLTAGTVVEPALFMHEPSLTRVPFTPWVAGMALASYLAAYTQLVRFERLMGRPSRFWTRLYEGWGVVFWMFPQLPIALVGARLLPEAPGPRLVGILGLALFTLWAVRGATVKFAVLIGALRPADARLSGIVARAAAQLGMDAPATFIARAPMVNALSLVHSRQLVFTESAAAGLDDEALLAITLHELGHLQEAPKTRRVRAAMLLPVFVIMTVFPLSTLLALQVYWVGLGILLLGVLVSRSYRAFSRRMETEADAVAHHHSEEPGSYARALERLHELGLMPVVMPNATHPHLYDRLVARGVTPSYPRPLPPPRRPQFAILLGPVFGALLVASGVMVSLDQVRKSDPELALVLTGTSHDVWSAAMAAWRASDWATAHRYYAAQAPLNDRRSWALEAARTALFQNDCENGARWLAKAKERASYEGDAEPLSEAEQGLPRCYAFREGERGRAKWVAEDLAGALAHYQQAATLDPSSAWYPAMISRLHANLGHCDEAQIALFAAQRLRTEDSVDTELGHAQAALVACRTQQQQALVAPFLQRRSD